MVASAVLEFVRDAGGKLAERGQALLHLHLPLQRRQFRQIAQQAQRSGRPGLALLRIGEMVTPSCRSSPPGVVYSISSRRKVWPPPGIRRSASSAATRSPNTSV